jgi:hypothetical protein
MALMLGEDAGDGTYLTICIDFTCFIPSPNFKDAGQSQAETN